MIGNSSRLFLFWRNRGLIFKGKTLGREKDGAWALGSEKNRHTITAMKDVVTEVITFTS